MLSTACIRALLVRPLRLLHWSIIDAGIFVALNEFEIVQIITHNCPYLRYANTYASLNYCKIEVLT